MNVWDLFKKYDCINIKIDSAEEMKEMLKLAKENNFEIPYEEYHEGIYVYFEGNDLEYTNADLTIIQKNKTIQLRFSENKTSSKIRASLFLALFF